MSNSLFTKLLSYKPSDNYTPFENYLTEIFAYCLKNDYVFRDSFIFECLKLESSINFSISTQNQYAEFGKPDIEIELDNYNILIENKVDSGEGFNQLLRYEQILKKLKDDTKKKILVYITMFYEQKELSNENVQLIQVRWYEIHNIIRSGYSETTQLLKKFLSDNNMSKSLNFNESDLSVLKAIPQTLGKMDELLNRIETDFKNYFGYFSKPNRTIKLPCSLYINYFEFKFDNFKYWLDIGFKWNDSEPSVWLGLEFESKRFKLTELKNILDKELRENDIWIYEDENNQVYYYKSKLISDFDTVKKDHLLSMQEYLHENLLALYKLKNIYPILFSK